MIDYRGLILGDIVKINAGLYKGATGTIISLSYGAYTKYAVINIFGGAYSRTVNIKYLVKVEKKDKPPFSFRDYEWI